MLVLLALVPCWTGVIVAGQLAWAEFRSATETPERPPFRSDIRLLFDEPGVVATAELDVQEFSDRLTEIYISVVIRDAGELNELGFAIYAFGGARSVDEAPYPGGPVTEDNGCWQLVYSSQVDDLKCETVRTMPTGNASGENSPLQDAQLFRGTMRRASSGSTWFATLTWYAPRTFETRPGRRRFIQLPYFGTVYWPPEWREDLALPFTSALSHWIPKELNVFVEYRDLGLDERVESIAPEPLEYDQFVWGELDSSGFAARASVVNASLEDDQQRSLFIAGGLIGLVAGVVPLLVWPTLKYGWRFIRRPREVHDRR